MLAMKGRGDAQYISLKTQSGIGGGAGGQAQGPNPASTPHLPPLPRRVTVTVLSIQKPTREKGWMLMQG